MLWSTALTAIKVLISCRCRWALMIRFLALLTSVPSPLTLQVVIKVLHAVLRSVECNSRLTLK